MQRHAPVILALVAAALVVFATLPSSAPDAELQLGSWCILCGSRGLADALLNLLLFLPLGAALTLLRGPGFALAGALLLSGLVEVAQFHIPGRFPTLGDLLFNAGGGLIGALCVVNAHRLRRALLAPSAAMKVLTISLSLAAFIAAGFFSTPRYPDRTYYGQWTHELGPLKPYSGRVISASIASLPLPDARIRVSPAVKSALRSGETLRLTAAAGPVVPEPAHLFALYDDLQREVLLVAVQGTDLLLHRRTRAVEARLDQPFLVWRGALTASPGDLFRISVAQGPANLCVSTNDATRCDLSPGVESGWRFLVRFDRASGSLLWILGGAWLFLLALPAGFTSSSSRVAILVGAGLACFGGLVSWLSPGLSLHLALLPLLVLGAWTGGLCRRALRARMDLVGVRV